MSITALELKDFLDCLLPIEVILQLVDVGFLSRIKPDAVLVNIGRGHLVDEDVLVVALDEGKLDYAIMDVFQDEPLPDDSVFSTGV